MVRIAGIDLPNEKRVDIALTYLYGIGRSNVNKVLHDANVSADHRMSALTDEDINRITKAIEKSFVIEGELRRQTQENIKRLREINAYRGMRHAKNLPVRGQRTRSNARTKRGKRVTIGAMKKNDRTRIVDKTSAEQKK